MQRLQKSAQTLKYVFCRAFLLRRLHALKKRAIPWDKAKIRVLLELRGQIQIEISEFEEPKERFICFSSKKTFSKDRLLYHKTSYRPLYRSEYSKIENKKYLDLIFRNERDEITEGARSNIIIKDKNDSFFTPPLSSGLLNGVYRQYFLKVSKNAKEKILTRDSLLNAKKIYLCNSLFGLKEVSLEERS